MKIVFSPNKKGGSEKGSMEPYGLGISGYFAKGRRESEGEKEDERGRQEG
jgi:hypothetical protein